MGKGGSDDWAKNHPDTTQNQPPPYSEATQSQPPPYSETERGAKKSSKTKCPTCCIKFKNCLMSPECGRCLQISQVIAFCGSCIRMWMCKYLNYNKGISMRLTKYKVHGKKERTHQDPHEKALSGSGRKKLPFNRKKSPAEPANIG